MELRNDLARLVAFDTTSHRPTSALAAWLAEQLEGLGFAVEEVAGDAEAGKSNLIARRGPPGTDGLTLSGHMDVVPTEGQPWSSDPFVLTERDGRWFGRGTADMKGFFAATLAALRRLAGAQFARELVCVWTYDEEVGCLGSARLASALSAKGERLPSACLIGEPTDFRILRMHPGHTAVQLDFEGRAAHSSRPDLGANALEAAAASVMALRALARSWEQERAFEGMFERPWVAMNVARLHGGSAINIVPDQASLQVGFRPMPGMDPEALHGQIAEAAARALRAEGLDVRMHARILRITPALLTPEGTPLQGLLCEHTHVHAPGAASFATDGGNLTRLGALPLVFGPGSITVAHQADEYVPVADLHRAVDVIEAVVRRRCVDPLP